jgi:hypothetical protein
MRFRRWPRPTSYEDTPRKRAAYLRKQDRECKSLPLFAEMIQSTQRDVETEMARRTERWDQDERNTRAARAGRWRDVRARLFALDPARRRIVRTLWQECPYPADPSYFGDLLHQIAIGRIDPERPPWVYSAKIRPKVTPNPTTFAQAFRKVGQRKIGGDYKTNAADEFTWCGNLGSGLLILTSRVRLNEPLESFVTSSAHRLRESHVGRFGHWVEIIVRGECSDAEFALIRRLARAADTRPVEVRRHDPRGAARSRKRE